MGGSVLDDAVAVSYTLSVLLTFFWKVLETLSMKLKLKGEQIHM